MQADGLHTDTLPNGFCPVLYATQNDLTDVATLLINLRVNLNVCDVDQQWTPLMHSISNKNEILAIKIIESDCDVNMVNGDGNTALHIATDTENEIIVKKLLAAQADSSICNDEGLTALDMAKGNEDDIIACLLQPKI